MKENISYELLADHQAKQLVNGIAASSCKVKLGGTSVNRIARTEIGKKKLHHYFRSQIEKKFALKWGC